MTLNESDMIPCLLCKGLWGLCVSMDLDEVGMKSGDRPGLGGDWEQEGGIWE